MIDFNVKQPMINEIKNEKDYKLVKDLLLDNEKIEFGFYSIRDKLFITNRRLIFANVQGITGKKTEFTTIPFSKIQMFSCESAGHIDFDSEFDLILANGGILKFDLPRSFDVKKVSKFIAEKIL